MNRDHAIYTCGWLAFWFSLPVNLYFIWSTAVFAVWCGAGLVCLAGAVFDFGIDRWWWDGVDRREKRHWFRGYILGAACQVGLVAFWAALVATWPDSYPGVTLLLGTAVCVVVAGGARRLFLRIRTRAAAS